MTVRQPATRHCVGNCLLSILSAAWVLMYTHKNAQVVTGLQTSCYKSVHKLSKNCVRTACSQLL
jgi:hypothetical protein